MANLREDREQKTQGIQERSSVERERGRQPAGTDVERRPQRGDLLLHSPFDMFRRMSQEMDRMFGTGLMPLWGRGTAEPLSAGGVWSPEVEMFERDGKLIVRADLPGLSKDDVKVELRDDILTIEGERNDERKEEREGFYRSERSYGKFFRTLPLPEGTTGEHCNASFRNGVLEITMDAPKKAERAGRRIEVTDGETRAKPA